MEKQTTTNYMEKQTTTTTMLFFHAAGRKLLFCKPTEIFKLESYSKFFLRSVLFPPLFLTPLHTFLKNLLLLDLLESVFLAS